MAYHCSCVCCFCPFLLPLLLLHLRLCCCFSDDDNDGAADSGDDDHHSLETLHCSNRDKEFEISTRVCLRSNRFSGHSFRPACPSQRFRTGDRLQAIRFPSRRNAKTEVLNFRHEHPSAKRPSWLGSLARFVHVSVWDAHAMEDISLQGLSLFD